MEGCGCPICFTGTREPGFPKKEDGKKVVKYDCGTKIEFQGHGNKINYLNVCKGAKIGKR